MNKTATTALFLARISLGWLFFYAGITKILDPNWSAQGFLGSAKTFPDLYAWFASPANINWVNFLNEWGLTLIGVALILGVFTKWASIAGILMMLLYYFPGLDFPYIDHGFIVDQHIIYIFLFALIASTKQTFALDNRLFKR